MRNQRQPFFKRNIGILIPLFVIVFRFIDRLHIEQHIAFRIINCEIQDHAVVVRNISVGSDTFEQLIQRIMLIGIHRIFKSGKLMNQVVGTHHRDQLRSGIQHGIQFAADLGIKDIAKMV